MRGSLRAASGVAAGLALAALVAEGRSEVFIDDFQVQSRLLNVPFAVLDAPVGEARAPKVMDQPAYLAGNAVAAFERDTLVLDEDSGQLLRVDWAGGVDDRLDIAPQASQVVVDAERARAYVVNRAADRIEVVDLSDGLKRVARLVTAAEPYGIALSPDRSTLLVTTVADPAVTAYSIGERRALWSITVGDEPRAIAISPRGDEALVTHLNAGVVTRLSLRDGIEHAPSVRYTALPARTGAPPNPSFQAPAAATSPDQGRSFSRNAFAATYLSNGVAIVPHQISTPHMATEGRSEVRGTYGGGSGFEPPVMHRIAFLTEDGARTASAHIDLHQPNAVAYEAATDTLYVTGYGSDEVAAIGAASQKSVHLQWKQPLGEGCGPAGIAVGDGGRVVVFCGLTRQLRTITNTRSEQPKMVASDALSKSRLSASARRGRDLFRRGRNPALSTQGAMACRSCHPEGRSDGLSWRIEGHNLQTPVLSGRVIGSHPFKWDGGDATLPVSLTNTVRRLGGTGITPEQAKDITAFLETLPRPRTPTVRDRRAVARGKQLFDSERTGCATCHAGALLTDQQRYDLAPDLEKVDTPSLVGLAVSAPYYHDGSAATLRTVLLENGSVHGMGKTSSLTDREIDDLIAYLETL